MYHFCITTALSSLKSSLQVPATAEIGWAYKYFYQSHARKWNLLTEMKWKSVLYLDCFIFLDNLRCSVLNIRQSCVLARCAVKCFGCGMLEWCMVSMYLKITLLNSWSSWTPGDTSNIYNKGLDLIKVKWCCLPSSDDLFLSSCICITANDLTSRRVIGSICSS